MNKILLLLTLVIISCCSQAQIMRMGPIIGYNYTSLPNSNISALGNELDYTPTYTMNIGATAVYNFENTLCGIESGLIYSPYNENYTGVWRNSPTSYYTLTAETKLKYLDLPILFRVGEISGFYGEIGPELSFLLSSGSNTSFDPSDSLHPSSSGNYSSDFSGFCFSGILGGGYTFKVKKTIYMDLGFRINYGFTDVTNQISQNDSTAHSVTSTYATYTKIKFTPTSNYGYASTGRIAAGMYLTLTFIMEGDTKFNNRFK